jgi:hypothetical protein
LGDRDGRLVIYDVAGRLLERYDTHDGEIRALGLLSGGSVLWSLGADGRLLYWRN